MEDFQRAIAVLEDSGFAGILNLSGGEPTFHERLPDLLRHASSRMGKARIALFTNGDWIGASRWREKLEALFAGPNVLIRFSHDRQHTEGKLRAAGFVPDAEGLAGADRERTRKAVLFRDAMLSMGGLPGVNFDFAFKGSKEEAAEYMAELGDVPVYLIKLREDPEKRPREYGFLAIDVQENCDLLVYPTLGHIPDNEPLGGLETLEEALAMNRSELKNKERVDEQQQWIKTDRN